MEHFTTKLRELENFITTKMIFQFKLNAFLQNLEFDLENLAIYQPVGQSRGLWLCQAPSLVSIELILLFKKSKHCAEAPNLH